MKNIKLFSFLLMFGAGFSSAFAASSDINNDPDFVNTNSEQDKLKTKSSQDKYSFTLFNFFHTQVQSKSDSSATIATDLNETIIDPSTKTGL